MKPVVSPKDLARAIAVSESSIKRWVDEGTIAAVKTSGGHRRIAIEEVIRFTRLTQTPIVHPEILGLPAEAADTAKPTNEADDAERLQLHLQNGDAPKARGLLISMYLRGAASLPSVMAPSIPRWPPSARSGNIATATASSSNIAHPISVFRRSAAFEPCLSRPHSPQLQSAARLRAICMFYPRSPHPSFSNPRVFVPSISGPTRRYIHS
ncbi:MAG: helix-turn-helix domain-containing protein [Planctomycetes bacterium]|nr:helix-turn-helix domain-containing protein [Planctomycetota bacterium]